MDPVNVGQLLSGEVAAFALLHRPHSPGGGGIDVLVGDATHVEQLAELPLPVAGTVPDGGVAHHDLLTLIPYRQITERGFVCRDDGTPLIALRVTGQTTMSVAEALRLIPNHSVDVRDGGFDVDDDSYSAVVRNVLSEEIGWGAGANFVIKRSFVAELDDYSPAKALAIFRRLLEGESGAYWTFIVHTGERTLIGATPERHVTSVAGRVVMNPISGTYRYPDSGPSVPDVLRFLADEKETDELYMVVDEELKMMGRVCDGGARVVGPYLKEMTRLAHTEYLLEGRSSRDATDILRETMFAPTVTGSPLENACRVISRYEQGGRGYYSGVVALVGRDSEGAQTLDSSILIRTADIDAKGRMNIGVGATLVRHSDPASEVAETHAKAAGLLAAIRGERTSVTGVPRPRDIGAHPEVRRALERRNHALGTFWLAPLDERDKPSLALADRNILVIDAEDTFTAMLAQQLRSLGPAIAVRRFDEPFEPDDFDLVLVGPGPGDPRDHRSPKIDKMRRITRRLLDDRKPFLSVCLGHQVLSGILGFPLVRREVPNQGLQRDIDLFGERVTAGFYNTFAAQSAIDLVDCGDTGLVEVSRDPTTGEVHALRGQGFRSMQFHAESILTQHGPELLGDLLGSLVAEASVPR
jgi:phenazine biosynthesis protein phzE